MSGRVRAGWLRRSSFAAVLCACAIAADPLLSSLATGESSAAQVVSQTVGGSSRSGDRPQARLLAELPADPELASIALVDQVHRADAATAEQALAELMRRSGIPLVSPDGPVVATPDDVVLADAAIYAAALPDLLRAVRHGDSYSAKQVALLLADIGVTKSPLAEATVIGGLGVWGKRPGAPLVSRVAGAAVRASAAIRRQMLFPAGAASVRIDMLQTLLVIAHATSRESRRRAAFAPGATGGLLAPAGPRLVSAARAAVGPCDELNQLAKGPQSQVGGAVYGEVKKQITDSWKDFALSESAKESLEKVGNVWDKGTAVVSVLLLYLGATIALTDDRGGTTHFKHERGDKSKHIHFTAKAMFDSNIAEKHLQCYGLAGIDVPKNGPLSGFRIRWYVDQPSARATGPGFAGESGKYLAPPSYSNDNEKLLHGEVTGPTGTSTLELAPPVEPEGTAKDGTELEGYPVITASLDKDDFPFKLGDLLGLKGIAGSKLWDLFISAISRASLPSVNRTVKVTYHGHEIYVAKGESTLFLFFYTLPVYLDIYTCTGLTGEWKGMGGFRAEKQGFAAALEALSGKTLPDKFAQGVPLKFKTSLAGGAGRFEIISPLLTGLLDVPSRPQKARHDFQPVGTAEILINGEPADVVAIFGAARWPIIQMPEDDRCPEKGTPYFE